MFDHYEIHPHLRRDSRQLPDWLADLERHPDTGVVHPGDTAPTIVGNPNDSLPLELQPLTWGMPNPWMSARGLNPFHGLVRFVTMTQGVQPTTEGGCNGYTRCLIPVTQFVADRDGKRVTLRDPDRPLLTLGGLFGGTEYGGEYRSGFCLLTEKVTDRSRSYGAPLAVSPDFYCDWLDSWNKLADVRRCGEPLLRSRLVEEYED